MLSDSCVKTTDKEDFIETAFTRLYHWYRSLNYFRLRRRSRGRGGPTLHRGTWLRTQSVASDQNGPQQRDTQSLYLSRQYGMPRRPGRTANQLGYLLPKYQLATTREQPRHCCHQAIR